MLIRAGDLLSFGLKITLDGKSVTDVVEADSALGYVIAYKRKPNGDYFTDARGCFLLEKVEGVVKFSWDKVPGG